MTKKTFFLFLLFGLYSSLQVFAQKDTTYWIRFTDKKGSPYTVDHPEKFLSQRSIDRRKNQNIAISETDLPVNPAYLDSIRNIGGKKLYTSRWLNAATFVSNDPQFPARLKKLSIVSTSARVRSRMKVQSTEVQDMMDGLGPMPLYEYGRGHAQLQLHHGIDLHNDGYTGEGMQIAQLDGGFYRTDSFLTTEYLRSHHGILAVKDFVHFKDSSVFTSAYHGLYVLSLMGGRLPGQLVGSAPDADYYLIQTENVATEYPVEEDAWVSGIEWADSAGADVINSSLGYTQFDDSTLNNTYADMNGHTTHCSMAASMAASKGIIVVCSAGNSGQQKWHHLSAPSDATDILCVGAVDTLGNIAPFSGRGPSSDGRVKPDVCGVGWHTVIASEYNGAVSLNNGTSLSAPIITGLVADLWQEYRTKTAYEIMDAVRRSSHLFNKPNDSFGYGIPDFALARQILKNNGRFDADFMMYDVYPNPFVNKLNIRFYSGSGGLSYFSINDIMGRELYHKQMQIIPFNYVSFSEGLTLPPGVYTLSMRFNGKVTSRKIIRADK